MLPKKTNVLNPNFPQISVHPYRILMIEGSKSGKTNALLNLISHQPDIDKIYFYPKRSIWSKTSIVT